LPEPVKLRVLIVDDAVVVRKALSDALSRDPELEVAGTASNGRLALVKFPQLHPDVILLDIEMPEMDGLEAVVELRKLDRHVPIIMFSTLTERGASATLEALSRGATDYVTKPSNQDMETTAQTVLEELIPKIKALCMARTKAPPKPGMATHALTTPGMPPLTRRTPSVVSAVKVVTIGVSTGGPEALARLLPTLPKNLGVPVVIAQHMPPVFTALLASRLATKCSVPVRECSSGEPLVPGTIWIAPGDFHMTVSREDGVLRLRTNQGPRENYCRPSVDVLFRSVANIYGSKALGVILTGMGQDGLKGCESLVAEGSRVIVQDEASSVVWGMPGFVARAGLAEKILPITEIGPEIQRRVSGALRVAL
jgi:two-component system, chemotaxis family, protein-glutamate methylesterase/glutaminase